MNAQTPTKADRRESSDSYHREIIRAGRWRIIEGACGIQWVLQYQTRAGGPDTARWEGQHYCVTREALARLWRTEAGEGGAAIKLMLPERFPRRADK